MAKILAFCGSSRTGSVNRRTLDRLVGITREHEGEVTLIDLRELSIPIYDGDLEAERGLPKGAARLRDAMIDANGLIIGCPEYNGFPTPLLVNSLDWASRSAEAKPDLSPFRDKVVLICSASPGGFGGMRAAGHLRTMLSGIGCVVLPGNISAPAAHNAFTDDGRFSDEGLEKRAGAAVDKLLHFVSRLG